MTVKEPRHVVFLIHGIRTQGEWAQRTASILQSVPNLRARPIRYEFFDIVRFLVPISSVRKHPAQRIARLIHDELSRNPASISIIAHSFGTFIVSSILELEPHIRIRRLVLCGSIIPDIFHWERYGHRLGPDRDDDWQVVNDCGMRDILPVLAKSITWGYGSSGRFGFGHPRVKDRFFPVGHSGFFADDFVKKYWLPYFLDGEIVEGELDRPTTSWWVSVLTVFKLRSLVLVALLTSMLWLWATINESSVRRTSGAPQDTNSESSVQRTSGAPQLRPDLVANCRGVLKTDAQGEARQLSGDVSEPQPTAPILCEQVLATAPEDAMANGLFARSLIAGNRREEAIARLERAASLGDAHSCLVLGYYYFLWQVSDRFKGIRYLQQAEALKNTEATLALGRAYETGLLHRPDYDSAATYYEKAANVGMAEGYYRLGQLYDWGLGVKQNIEQARTLYLKAAGLGYLQALEALNELTARQRRAR